jgi:hypothetical protein
MIIFLVVPSTAVQDDSRPSYSFPDVFHVVHSKKNLRGGNGERSRQESNIVLILFHLH